MINTYARARQLPTRTIQARDIIPGDTVMIRLAGATDRTPHTVRNVEHVGGDIVLTFDHSTHHTSPRMTIALA